MSLFRRWVALPLPFALLVSAGSPAQAGDAGCRLPSPAGVMEPQIACRTSPLPDSVPFAGHTDVQATPVVFRAPGSAGPISLVATLMTAPVEGNYSEHLGVLRIFSAEDCSYVTTLGGSDLDFDGVTDWLVSTHAPAVADLDRDGDPEIVVAGANGSTIAFTSQAAVWQPSPMWIAPYPAGSLWQPCNVGSGRCLRGWGGVAIHDIDGDGDPEVIREGLVFSHQGAVKAMQPPDYATVAGSSPSRTVGAPSLVMNLDDDPAIELTDGALRWEWTPGPPSAGWVADAGFVAAGPAGFVAVAEFGSFGPPGVAPEIVRAGNEHALLDSSGAVIASFDPGAVAAPPAVSDFDGDGWPESAALGSGVLRLFDPDCGPSPRPGGVCPPGDCAPDGPVCPEGVAWSRPVDDLSSGVTPALAFDFEGDGASELVYADECFTRAFAADGDVLFSRPRSSCTWQESPVVAAVGAGGETRLVVPSNSACGTLAEGASCEGLGPGGIDPLFSGAACAVDADCLSGSCDAGLCRCSGTAQCCEAGTEAACHAEGFLCAAPDPGTPGSGNTCRVADPGVSRGLTLYRDPRWAVTRPIWNQAAFADTHIDDAAVVPAAADWIPSWAGPLNGFLATPSQPPDAPDVVLQEPSLSCSAGVATIAATVCNEGDAVLPAGIAVEALDGSSARCTATTAAPLAPGACSAVACDWPAPPADAVAAVDLVLQADAGAAAAECRENNNTATLASVFCPIAPAIFGDGFETP